MKFLVVGIGFLIWFAAAMLFILVGPFFMSGVVPALFGCFVATSSALFLAGFVRTQWFGTVPVKTFANYLAMLVAGWLISGPLLNFAFGYAYEAPNVTYAAVVGHLLATLVWWRSTRRAGLGSI